MNVSFRLSRFSLSFGFRAGVLLSCVMWIGCAQNQEGNLDSYDNTGNLSKADITVGPIQSIQCNPKSHFVRTGGFGGFVWIWPWVVRSNFVDFDGFGWIWGVWPWVATHEIGF